MEEKKFGKYYECIREKTKDVPKMSRAELHERLQSIHTVEASWARIEAEKRSK